MEHTLYTCPSSSCSLQLLWLYFRHKQVTFECTPAGYYLVLKLAKVFQPLFHHTRLNLNNWVLSVQLWIVWFGTFLHSTASELTAGLHVIISRSIYWRKVISNRFMLTQWGKHPGVFFRAILESLQSAQICISDKAGTENSNYPE